MNQKDLRELDVVIAKTVMGWKRGQAWGNGNGEWIIDGKGYDSHRISWMQTPRYTTDPAASDALDDVILKKLDDEGYEIWCRDGVFMIRVNKKDEWAKHPDKKICRALFAKQLFSK